MNIKFLDKVCDQIISETKINNDGEIHTPFLQHFLFSVPRLPFSVFLPFSKHCKGIYCLNEQEIDYVWKKYKEGVTTLINEKELV